MTCWVKGQIQGGKLLVLPTHCPCPHLPPLVAMRGPQNVLWPMHCGQKRCLALPVGVASSPTAPSLATENPETNTQRISLPVLALRDLMSRALANLMDTALTEKLTCAVLVCQSTDWQRRVSPR